MGNIGHEIGATSVGDSPELLPVGRPGIGGVSGDDDLGSLNQRLVHDAVIVQPSVAIYTIGHHLVALARDIELAAMGQVTTLKEIHAHQCVTSLHESIIDRQVGGRARQSLDIDIDIARSRSGVGEQGGAPALGQCLHKVDIVGPFVEAPVGVASIVGQLMI